MNVPVVEKSGQAAQLTAYTETLPGSAVAVEMLPVPGGALQIGGKRVEIKPFYLAKTETTWEAFDTFLASGPPSRPYDQTEYAPDAVARPSKTYILPDLGWGHNGFPAINLSSMSAEMYCRWLSSATKKKYRLPTEAEWEWACREASGAPWKSDPAALEKASWNAGNAGETTRAVGKKVPNKLGFVDLLGNVGEWAIGLDGQPVLCGPTFLDPAAKVSPGVRRKWSPKWQETDPQIPKSRWWLSDGPFAGFRVVCEP